MIGAPQAGRVHPDLEGVVGPFVNTVALRVDVSKPVTARELLRRVSRVALGAQDHVDLPFERLVEDLKLQRDLSRTPLFQVMFALQNAPKERLSISGLEFEAVRGEPKTAKFDLALTVEETGTQMNADERR